MSASWNHRGTRPGGFAAAAPLTDSSHEDLLIATCLASASQGETEAYYTLGVAYSTGSHGVGCDLIEAHKWFNIAAARGHAAGAEMRREVAELMSDSDIGRAQRAARDWLKANPLPVVAIEIRAAA